MWSLSVLMLVLCAAFCLAESDEAVPTASVELKENNFIEETNDRNVLVLFYSPRYVSIFCHIQS